MRIGTAGNCSALRPPGSFFEMARLTSDGDAAPEAPLLDVELDRRDRHALAAGRRHRFVEADRDPLALM